MLQQLLNTFIITALLFCSCKASFQNKGERLYNAKKKKYSYVLYVNWDGYDYRKHGKNIHKTFVLYSVDGKKYEAKAIAYRYGITSNTFTMPDSIPMPDSELRSVRALIIKRNSMIYIDHPAGYYTIKFHSTIDYDFSGYDYEIYGTSGLEKINEYLEYLKSRITIKHSDNW